jgi:hypothetical protein
MNTQSWKTDEKRVDAAARQNEFDSERANLEGKRA